MKKVGLFGGTFNPVHNGHVAIAKSFLNSGFIDELWVLLTPDPPHKDDQNFVVYNLRKKMLEEAFKDLDAMVLTVEDELPKPSYTYQTITHLKNKYPTYIFYYCIGEDSLDNFHTWKEYMRILASVTLLVAKRSSGNSSQTDTEILDKAVFIPHKEIHISSSDIRKRLLNDQEINHLVPIEVLEVIKKYKLYKN